MPTRTSFIYCFCPIMALGAVLLGCVTAPPPPQGGQVSAYSVGDRVKVSYDEVVVTAWRGDNTGKLMNLHVSIAAAANPIRPTRAGPYDAQSIIQACENRVAAEVNQDKAGLQLPTIEAERAFRAAVLDDAKRVIESAMKQWEFGDDFKVEVMVTSYYWTDLTVGRVLSNRRW